MDDDRDPARPPRPRRPGRRPHPGPDASPFALVVWRASEDAADLLDQFPPGEDRERAAEQLYCDADGTVRTRHRLLRPVSDPGAPA